MLRVIGCVAFCFILGAGAAESPTASPAEAFKIFNSALETGDLAALAVLSSGDAKEKAWIMAYADHLLKLHDLEQALSKRYGREYSTGETGKEISSRIASAKDEDLIADLKKAKLGKAGPDAVLIILDESRGDDLQARMVREKGQWAVDLSSLSNYFSVDDTAGLEAIAHAARDLARDVKAGKFATIDDAAKAVQERLDDAEAVGARKPVESPNAPPKAP